MNLLLIGPQGSGKGTQARIIADKNSYCHISMGDLLRGEVSKGNLKIKKIIDKGTMVPDEWTIGLIKERIIKSDCKKGIVLDGFPRNMNQVEMLKAVIKLDAVIMLDMPDSVAVKRLTSRRQCRNCGRITNMMFKKCACGGKLYQREDDEEDAIIKRLEYYHRETEKMIKYFEKNGLVKRINAGQPIENVTKDIEKAIRL